MGLITFTNTLTQGILYIDTATPVGSRSSGIGAGRYAKWTFAASEVKKIDEGEIDTTVDNALPDAVKSGQLIMLATDVDGLNEQGIKNFLMKALGQIYKKAGATLTVKEAVGIDSTSSSLNVVATNGAKPFGVVQLAGNLNDTVRVQNDPFTLATCVASGVIAVGDKVIVRTDGKVQKSSTTGLWQLGTAKTAATDGSDVSIQIEIKLIP